VNFSYLLIGLIIGLSIAAPIGPIGVLCIRRTLAEGRIIGLVSGLGAATADAFYGAIAGFGLTFISNILVSYQVWLRLFGGLFLCVLGIKTLLSKPTENIKTTKGNDRFSAYGSTLLLTLTNPTTIISFVALFTGLGIIGTGNNYLSAGILVLGVFLGSALWWLILSSGVCLFREKINNRGMLWVNRISGAIITCFGLFALISII
jgi:threonine/homoserine/homoserine lactone efflux protein